ncbi:MAG: beta-galactosidase family protein [Terriglobia bacterium]
MNKMNRRKFIGASTAVLGLWNLPSRITSANAGRGGATPLPGGTAQTAARTFGYKGEHFLLDGEPLLLISGEMHYPRVPRPYWRDRMRKMRALGLNTLCTYVFWNLHEPELGKFDFTGNLDVAAYLRMAQEEGLWVMLRPGPYICTEWDFGGLPSWLLSTPDLKVRTTDPRFLKAAEKYLQQVGEQLAPLQITRGGPIIMVQVENEYGSFGNDHDYMNAIRRIIRDAGFEVTLYTADGPENLEGGTLPDLPAGVNFGQGDPAAEFAKFAGFRQGVPRMCTEYWDGWFDHWGEEHHTTSPEGAARGLDWMLSRGISASLYMVHGGTSWGFMSGANFDGTYQPDISSYDYDAPLDEAGRPTRKFFLMREVIKKYLPTGAPLPELPAPLPMIEIPPFELREAAALPGPLGKPVLSEQPKTMEDLGQPYGFVLYRKRLAKRVKARLEIKGVRDYAVVLQGARRLGVLDRRLKQESLEVDLEGGEPLDILVENMGRVNFGPRLVDDRKGIVGQVTLAGSELSGWENYPLPMTDLSALQFSRSNVKGPAFLRGQFELSSLGDTFLDMRGWGKGYVWLNGYNLGRYWKIGPQQCLFAPSLWLRKGINQVIVLDLEPADHRTLQGIKDPIWSGGTS